MTEAKANFAIPLLRRHIFSILTFLTMFNTAELNAQETSVDLEYRINPIYSRGFRQPLYDGDRAGFFTMQRTRLILNYANKDSLRAQVILQDRRAWGEASDRQDVFGSSNFSSMGGEILYS